MASINVHIRKCPWLVSVKGIYKSTFVYAHSVYVHIRKMTTSVYAHIWKPNIQKVTFLMCINGITSINVHILKHFCICAFTKVDHFLICAYMEGGFRKCTYMEVLQNMRIYRGWLTKMHIYRIPFVNVHIQK
jgi:hypothetical protein